METNNKEGCALCDATWGEYYREIDGEKMLFCCNICADIFGNMVAEIKRRTGWNSIDYVELVGNYSSGRNCKARNGGSEYKYYFRTYSDGRLMKFEDR
ncbi:MAG: TA0938 family protein [Thermoplasmataceae archaeon]